ncbi:MAG: hypothetical protein IT379_11525, partial [Deltaproteobacteria bacterium]|nr:hypothetical protein [Deltaproteobacteria bacterium]
MWRRLAPWLMVLVSLSFGTSLGLALASCGDDDGGGGLCPEGQRVCSGVCRTLSSDN